MEERGVGRTGGATERRRERYLDSSHFTPFVKLIRGANGEPLIRPLLIRITQRRSGVLAPGLTLTAEPLLSLQISHALRGITSELS